MPTLDLFSGADNPSKKRKRGFGHCETIRINQHQFSAEFLLLIVDADAVLAALKVFDERSAQNSGICEPDYLSSRQRRYLPLCLVNLLPTAHTAANSDRRKALRLRIMHAAPIVCHTRGQGRLDVDPRCDVHARASSPLTHVTKMVP